MARSNDKCIWVLSELYYPEESATGYNVTKVAEGLALRHRVRVLTAQPTYKARGTRAPKDEIRNNVQIHRCAATTLDKDILAFRLVNLFTISISIFVNAIKRINRGDVVLVVTNPPTLPFLVFLACKLRGAKLVLRIEDVYPEALVAAGFAKQGSVVVRALDLLHRKLYTGVDRVIVLGRDMMQLVQNKIGNNAAHLTIITNWADTDQIVPLPRGTNALLQRHGIAEKFVVQYSGNMGRTHDIESLVQCAKRLESDDQIHFLFIGWGAKEPWLKKSVQELGLRNVIILPPQPRADLAVSLNACDVAIISFVSGMSGVSVPSRMYNIMAAGKPIIAVADKSSELAQMVEEENVGWVVEPELPERIAEVLLKAKSHRQLLVEMSARASTCVVEKYSEEAIMRKYESLMDSMQSNSSSGSGNPA